MPPRARRLFAILGATAATANWAPAQAMDEGFYMGGFYAQTEEDPAIEPFDDLSQRFYEADGLTLLAKDSRLTVEDKAWGFIVGYRWLPWLAFEGTYLELSDVRYNSDDVVGFETDAGTDTAEVSNSIKTRIRGPAVSALAILPVTYEFELFARGGVMFSSSNIALGASYFRGNIGNSDSSADWLAGAGAAYTFLDVYTARLEYQRVFDAGVDDLVLEDDIDFISLQIVVTF